MVRQANEIVILRRFPGYVRLHIPPLIYSGKAAYLLESELLTIDGIRKVAIKKELGKLSVHFDNVLVPESQVFLAINRIATPLLREDQQGVYEKTIVDVEAARRKRIARKIVVAVILTYLVKIHWRLVSRRWIRDPVRYWAPLMTLGVLIYIHRKQLKGAVDFD